MQIKSFSITAQFKAELYSNWLPNELKIVCLFQRLHHEYWLQVQGYFG